MLYCSAISSGDTVMRYPACSPFHSDNVVRECMFFCCQPHMKRTPLSPPVAWILSAESATRILANGIGKDKYYFLHSVPLWLFLFDFMSHPVASRCIAWEFENPSFICSRRRLRNSLFRSTYKHRHIIGSSLGQKRLFPSHHSPPPLPPPHIFPALCSFWRWVKARL